MRTRWIQPAAVVMGIAALTLTFASTFQAQEAPRYAGPTDKGFLLPNGWTLKPAGQHILLADLPLNIVPLADNRHVLVATSGYNAHELSLVDLEQKKVVDHQAVRQSWFGLAATPDADKIWWSGGGGNQIHAFRLAGSSSDAHEQTRNPRRSPRAARPRNRNTLAVDWRSTRFARCFIRSTSIGGTISALDPTSLKELKSARPARGPMTSLSHETAHNCLSPTGPAAWCASSIPATSARSPRSPSASIPTRSPFIPRTIGSSSLVPRAIASR